MSRVLPCIFAASLALFGMSSPVAAQELAAANSISAATLFPTTPLVPATAVLVTAEAAEAATPTFVRNSLAKPHGRPAPLPALYVAQGALQTDVNVALPWAKTVVLDPGVELRSVTATSVAGQLNCSITDASGATIAAQNNNTLIAACTK